MKLKEVIYSLGWKPRPRTYGFEVETQDLGHHGAIQYAHWLNPIAMRHRVTAEEVDELSRFIRPGDLCVDVGAHCGDTSVPMGLAAGPEGCVVAMEPNRYLFHVLEENARLNADRANIATEMAAATPKPGRFTFGYTDPGFCNGGDGRKLAWWRRRRLFPLEVVGVQLDSLLRQQYADRLDRLRYIKTDTEGNDLELLRSIAGLLTEYRPYLRVEVYKFSPADYRNELHALLTSLGYEVRSTRGVAHLFGEPLTAEQVCQLGHDDIFCVPREAAAVEAA